MEDHTPARSNVGSIYRYADVGILHFMVYPQCATGEGRILETLSTICADDYFTLVEITWIKDPEVRKAAKAMLAQSGIKYVFGSQPPQLSQKLNLNDPDEAGRRKAVAQIKANIDEAVEMGCGALSFLTGKHPGAAGKARGLDLLYESVTEICEYARGKGDLPIALETFDQVDYGKNTLLGPTADAVPFAERVRAKYPNFGLLLDLSHMPLLGESPREMLVPAKDVLVHIHIGNCLMRDASHPAYGDNHPRFGIPGGENGVDELAAFLEILFQIGYLDGETVRPISFEVKPVAALGETSEMIIANSKRMLTKAWALL
ncbi:MAG: sugar phosphate isomerase/epimerase [Verrucomicrobia bacterium]|nr:sugar phosphate isomerase/epimerase [Verrucomicrobiota bacterium]